MLSPATHLQHCQPANVLFGFSGAEKINMLPSFHIKQHESMKKTHWHKRNRCTSKFMHQGSGWRVDGCIWGFLEHEGRPEKWEIHWVSPEFHLEVSHFWQYRLLHLQTSSIISQKHHFTTSPSSLTNKHCPPATTLSFPSAEHGQSHPISVWHTKWHKTNNTVLFLVCYGCPLGALILCVDLTASGV